MKLKDILRDKGKTPKIGFHTNIERDTTKNNNFRKVLFTGDKIQLVVMSLKPNEDIGLETHSDIDQFIRVDKGNGKAVIGGKNYNLKDGDAIIIPAKSEHNIIAGSNGIKLYTVYGPPNHKDKTIHRTKKDSMKAEHGT